MKRSIPRYLGMHYAVNNTRSVERIRQFRIPVHDEINKSMQYSTKQHAYIISRINILKFCSFKSSYNQIFRNKLLLFSVAEIVYDELIQSFRKHHCPTQGCSWRPPNREFELNWWTRLNLYKIITY